MNTITIVNPEDSKRTFLYLIDGVLYPQKGYDSRPLAMKAAKAKVLRMVMKARRKVN